MTLTRYRSKGSRLTTEEADDNLDHLSESANHNYTPATGALTDVAHTVKSFLDKLGNAGASLGAALIGFLQDGIGAIARTVSAKLREQVSVLDFIPVALHAGIAAGTNTDDLTAYFVLAFATGKKVFAPAGTYHCNVTQLPNKAYLYGEGEATVIKAYDTDVSTIKCLSADASTFIIGIVIRDLKLLGTVATEGFQVASTAMLLELGGVKRCLLENLYFEGFRVDALYLRGNVAAALYHNVDVRVLNCTFDGVNNDNRNAISVIDVDGLVVQNPICRNCTRSNMPGAIDIEPNLSGSVIKNIEILNMKSSNCDGNRGHVAISVENITTAQDIKVWGGEFSGNNAISLYTNAAVPTNPHAFIFGGFTVDGVDKVLNKQTGSVYGLTLQGVRGNCTQVSNMGDGTAAGTLKSIKFLDNDVPGSAGIHYAHSALTIEEWSFKRNTVRGATQACVALGPSGATISYCSVTDNTFLGTPSNGDIQVDANTQTSRTNVYLNNISTGKHGFHAALTDFSGTTANNNAGPITIASLPSTYPFGISRTVHVVGSTGAPTSAVAHVVHTHKQALLGTTHEYTFQWAFPINSAASNTEIIYFRKGTAADAWTGWFQIMGSLANSVITTAVGNVGSGEDTLMSYTMPANVLATATRGVHVVQHGAIANNANPKTLSCQAGGVDLFTDQALTVSVASQWHIEYDLISTGTDAQSYFGTLTYESPAGTWVTKPFSGTLTQDDGATIDIRCRGTVTDGGGGINNNDITQTLQTVQLIR